MTEPKSKPKTKKAGRPAGSKNAKHVADAPASRCPSCDSTNRSKYGAITTVVSSGVDASGKPYTEIVWRTCRCLDCGQTRRDRSFEYTAPQKRKPAPKTESAQPPKEVQDEQCLDGKPTQPPPLFVPTPLGVSPPGS